MREDHARHSPGPAAILPPLSKALPMAWSVSMPTDISTSRTHRARREEGGPLIWRRSPSVGGKGGATSGGARGARFLLMAPALCRRAAGKEGGVGRRPCPR